MAKLLSEFKGFQDYLGPNADLKTADVYRKALERAAYGDYGRAYGAGLNDITSYLARSGPLADSGAATALRARLASQLYGQAQSRIQGGYADYLRQLQLLRQQSQYAMQLAKYQKKQQGGFNLPGALLGAAGGFAAGGPIGAGAGAASGGFGGY